MYDFDAVFVRVRDASEIPRLFDSMLKSLDELLQSHEVGSPLVREALGRLKDLLETNRGGSYASLCGVLWNLKFYKAAIGHLIDGARTGREFLALVDQTDRTVRKSLRPKLMRLFTELLTNRQQLQSFRALNDKTLDLPGRDES